MGLEPQEFFWAYFIAARITFTCILYPQCTCMIFIIYTSCHIHLYSAGNSLSYYHFCSYMHVSRESAVNMRRGREPEATATLCLKMLMKKSKKSLWQMKNKNPHIRS